MSCQVCWGEWAGCCGVKGGSELVFVGNQKNNKSGKYCDTLCPEEYRKGRCVCVCVCVCLCVVTTLSKQQASICPITNILDRRTQSV